MRPASERRGGLWFSHMDGPKLHEPHITHMLSRCHLILTKRVDFTEETEAFVFR